MLKWQVGAVETTAIVITNISLLPGTVLLYFTDAVFSNIVYTTNLQVHATIIPVS